MLTKHEFKLKLLATNQFIDNTYLESYIDLIYNPSNRSTEYAEKHHAIPVACYKNTKDKTRRQAEKLANADKDNFIVTLIYKEHCLAHCLLYFCIIDSLKQNYQITACRMLTMHNILLHDVTITGELPSIEDLNDIQQYVDRIKADNCSNYWTAEEDNYLIANYADIGPIACANNLNRSYQSVRHRASQLKIRCTYNNTSGLAWTSKEIEILRTNYPLIDGVAKCCKLLNRSKQNIICKAWRLGIKSCKGYTDVEVSFLIENYPVYGPAFCAKHLNRSYKSVCSWWATYNKK